MVDARLVCLIIFKNYSCAGAPRILEIRPQPNTQGVITFNEEETARVDCVFSDGFPPSKARWTLHGKIISTVTSTTSQEGGEIIHILTLVLQNLRPNDSGKYICEVSNEENPGSFRQIQIAVKSKLFGNHPNAGFDLLTLICERKSTPLRYFSPHIMNMKD